MHASISPQSAPASSTAPARYSAATHCFALWLRQSSCAKARRLADECSRRRLPRSLQTPQQLHGTAALPEAQSTSSPVPQRVGHWGTAMRPASVPCVVKLLVRALGPSVLWPRSRSCHPLSFKIAQSDAQGFESADLSATDQNMVARAPLD